MTSKSIHKRKAVRKPPDVNTQDIVALFHPDTEQDRPPYAGHEPDWQTLHPGCWVVDDGGIVRIQLHVRGIGLCYLNFHRDAMQRMLDWDREERAEIARARG
jgi:hypothetical protein